MREISITCIQWVFSNYLIEATSTRKTVPNLFALTWCKKLGRLLGKISDQTVPISASILIGRRLHDRTSAASMSYSSHVAWGSKQCQKNSLQRKIFTRKIIRMLQKWGKTTIQSRHPIGRTHQSHKNLRNPLQMQQNGGTHLWPIFSSLCQGEHSTAVTANQAELRQLHYIIFPFLPSN